MACLILISGFGGNAMEAKLCIISGLTADERRMRRGDDLKRTTELALDAELAFPAAKGVTDLGILRTF